MTIFRKLPSRDIHEILYSLKAGEKNSCFYNLFFRHMQLYRASCGSTYCFAWLISNDISFIIYDSGGIPIDPRSS